LSYTSFQYKNLIISKKRIRKNKSIKATATITNTGKYKADEVVQLYISDVKPTHHFITGRIEASRI